MDAGLDAGVELPYTCRGGICGCGAPLPRYSCHCSLLRTRNKHKVAGGLTSCAGIHAGPVSGVWHLDRLTQATCAPDAVLLPLGTWLHALAVLIPAWQQPLSRNALTPSAASCSGPAVLARLLSSKRLC